MQFLKEVRNYVGNYHVKSGLYHYYRNEFSQAVDYLRKALRKPSELSEMEREYARCYLTLAFSGLAEKLEAKGDLAGGVDELRRAARVSPRYPDIHYRMALLLERLERRDEAIEAYLRAVRCHPDYLDARIALAFCLLRAGRIEQAGAAFEEALTLKMKRMETPFRRGIELMQQGEPAEAADFLHQAFREVPQLSVEYLSKALDWMRAEEYEKALAELERAMEISPKYPDIRNCRGIVLCELERYDEAIESFSHSVALAPGHRVPLLNLAFALLRGERIEEAMVVLESVLEQQPDEPVALAKLEELRTGRPSEKRRAAPKGELR